MKSSNKVDKFGIIIHELIFKMDSVTFGELIRKKRLEIGAPIREIASQIQLDQSLLSKIERNKMQAPSRIVLSLSKALGFDFEYLQKKYWSERIYNEIREQDFGKEALEIALKRIEKSSSGTLIDLKRENLISKIKAYMDEQPIEKVWLFGSFARNEASYDSDIDLLIKFDKEKKIDLFDYIGIRQDLEDLTGRQVDLVEEGQVIAKIKPIIDKEKKLIYERQAI